MRHGLQEKVNLFEPIITVFVANGERYNLLNSVVLEMIDFIRKENLKILVRHFMEKHYARVEDIDYDDTFVKLKDKYEQMLENGRDGDPLAASVQLHANRIRKDERALDRGNRQALCVLPAITHRGLMSEGCISRGFMALRYLELPFSQQSLSLQTRRSTLERATMMRSHRCSTQAVGILMA